MTLQALISNFDGEILTDNLQKRIYSTDASVYQKTPIAVALPKTVKDLKALIRYVSKHNLSLIPRAAGTSLAGQCVGSGIVVDIGRYFNDILHLDEQQKTVRVHPGVIRDDLNLKLKPHNLFFGPNTSTSNRCMIGGMVGNNSSGTTSIQYGVTRDKVISLKCILADSKEVEFKSYPIEVCKSKAKQNDVEGEIYRYALDVVNDKDKQDLVLHNYPKAEIHRRNTGYALDDLITNYNKTAEINLARLICGSEGTLCLITEITIQLDDLPPKYSGMIAAHFNSIDDCMQAVPLTMKHDLHACEMMDDNILECTRQHIKYKNYRFFIKDDPKAILFLELKSNSKKDLEAKLKNLQKDITSKTNCYATPVLKGDEIEKAFTLRKAGLGLLGSIVGDTKAVACIEDTAVALEDLENYIREFSILMKSYNQNPVYYAHAGAGELHLRPMLNLKTEQGVADFVNITKDVAHLVKSYQGSLSGEHGDGIVRSNFIELMIGERCYQFLKELKYGFDANNIFNPGKIINAYPVEENLRYEPGRKEPVSDSFLNFRPEGSFLGATENCNGSGDCRKTELSSGGMCPSYHATRNEKDTTRARANALRHFITNPGSIEDKELMSVFDLCISCKACKRECPSNVDVSSFKAEITYQYYQKHSRPARDYMIAFNDKLNTILQPFSRLYNFVESSGVSKPVKQWIGFHSKRSLPALSKQTFRSQFNSVSTVPKSPKKTVYLFVDEFTNRLEADIGIDALVLLNSLGYEVKILPNKQSGRAYLSKGFLKQAKEVATFNIELFKDIIDENTPLIGIEPSAILSFRDDYIRLADQQDTAKALSKHVFLIEEFLSQEIKNGNISSDHFKDEVCTVKLHIHCHHKALSNSKVTFDVVNVVKNAKVTIIPSGCCGMAGGFGYEKEHYDVSIKIGELILLPAVRKSTSETYIIANGSSCRHQIKDGADRKAIHPVSFLKQMLLE
jgi:FAD/FMN-containing dehydrogenase/Fe-S oxidoreductase